MRENICVNYVSTWNIHCGIAEYSRFLIDAMNQFGNVKIKIFPVTNKRIKNPFQYIKLAINVGKSCDVVHIQYQPLFFSITPLLLSYFPFIILLLRMRSKAKIVITIHELGIRKDPGVKLNMSFMKMAHLIIVHSNAIREELLQSGFKEERIIQIPNGTLVGQLLDKSECKNNLKLMGKRVLIVFGYIIPNKGYDLVIKALPHIPQDTILLVLGSPRRQRYLDYLKNLAEDLCVEERVKFLGFISNEDLPTVISATDIAVFPYRNIEISAALHRILGYRMPTICSDLSYFKEIEQAYKCVEIFRKDDYQELSKVIVSLLSDQDRMSHLSKRCDEFIESTNWNVVASRTIKSFMVIIAERETRN